MKIGVINGSQKTAESNSGILVRELNKLLAKDNEIGNYTLGTKRLSPEIYGELASGGAMVFVFPLYTDSIPPNVLEALIELEGCVKKGPKNEVFVYAVINNGFYEGKQTHIAFEIMENWCERSGALFGGGIGQGAGEMIGATKNIPLGKGPFHSLWKELKLLAEKIESKEPFGIKYLTPGFPRFLWRFMAVHTFWHPLARKNKLTKKDIVRKLR